MYKVYILKSTVNTEKTYVGLTSKKIDDRLKEHNSGLSAYTRSYKPWILIYYENFYCKLCADKREQFLKSGFGYRFRKIIIENYEKLK